MATIEETLSRMAKQILDLQTELRTVSSRITHAPLNSGMASVLTIASGVINVSRPHILLLPESGTEDNLDTILPENDGKMIVLAVHTPGDIIHVRDMDVGGGNIDLHSSEWLLDHVNASLILYFVAETGHWQAAGVGRLDELRNVNAESGVTGDVLVLQGDGDWLATDPATIPTIPVAHAPTHQHGGGDEVATAVPAADAIPKAEASGDLDIGWINQADINTDNLTEGATNLFFTAAEETKLAGIAAGAEVNVNADWNSVAGDSEILNKPTITAYALTLLDDANIAAAQATLALTPGTDVQAFDAELAAIAGLTSAADRLPYFTGLGTAALATFTAYGRTLAALADAAAGRTALGLGTIAVEAETAYAKLAGRAGGQTLKGDTASGGDLTLESTAHATKGNIVLAGPAQYSDPNVAHGITSLLPTDRWLWVLQGDPLAGGAQFIGFSDSDARAFFLTGVLGTATPSADTAAVTIQASKKNGTTIQALAAGETILLASNNGATRMRMRGNGDLLMVSGAALSAETIKAIDADGLSLQTDDGITRAVLEDDGDWLRYGGASSAYTKHTILDVADVTRLQTVTIDVECDGNVRAYETTVSLLFARNGNNAVYANAVGRVVWSGNGGGSGIIRGYDLENYVSGSAVFTVAAITDGIRFSFGGGDFLNTMTENQAVVETNGQRANLTTVTVTVT